MKRKLSYFIAAAVLLLCSCSKDTYPTETPLREEQSVSDESVPAESGDKEKDEDEAEVEVSTEEDDDEDEEEDEVIPVELPRADEEEDDEDEEEEEDEVVPVDLPVSDEETADDEEEISPEMPEKEDNIFRCNGYTVYVDPEKWEDLLYMKDEISRYQTENGIVNEFTYEELTEAYDGMFLHRQSYEPVVFFVSTPLPYDLPLNFNYMDRKYREMTEESEYEELLWTKEVNIDGVKGFCAEMADDIDGEIARGRMYIFWKNSRQVAFTYSCADEYFDEYAPDFEEMIESLHFTDE